LNSAGRPDSVLEEWRGRRAEEIDHKTGHRRMSALAFDTHAFIKRLMAAGMPEQQAEILADQQSRLIDEKLSTKEDLARVEAGLRSEIRQTELKLETRIEAAKSDIVKWLFGTIGFQTVIIIGAVIASARLVHP
jgi:hypothetical protein